MCCMYICVCILLASTCSYVLEFYVLYMLYSELVSCVLYVLQFMQCWLAREKFFMCCVQARLTCFYLYIRECGSTLYVGMTRTAARAAYRLIQK